MVCGWFRRRSYPFLVRDVGIEAAANHRYGSEDVSGKRILIQGVGAVGGEMARLLKERGAAVVSGGTDTHLALIDLTPLGVTGKDADEALERAAITCNKNGIPNDPLPPVKTSGIRVGSPAGTTRGFGPAEFREIANMVADVLDGLKKNGEQGDAQVEANVRERVRTLCERFPIYPEL